VFNADSQAVVATYLGPTYGAAINRMQASYHAWDLCNAEESTIN